MLLDRQDYWRPSSQAVAEGAAGTRLRRVQIVGCVLAGAGEAGPGSCRPLLELEVGRETERGEEECVGRIMTEGWCM